MGQWSAHDFLNCLSWSSSTCMDPMFTFLLIFLFGTMVTIVAYKIKQGIWFHRTSPITWEFIIEPFYHFLLAVELSLCANENRTFRQISASSYSLSLFLNDMRTFCWDTDKRIAGNPLVIINNVIQRRVGPFRAIGLILVQLVGGCTALIFSNWLWKLHLTGYHNVNHVKFKKMIEADHKDELHMIESSLTVSVFSGMLLQYTGILIELTLHFIAASLILGAKVNSVKTWRMYLVYTCQAAISTIITLILIDYTGFYTNPMKAFSNNYGLGKEGRLGHLLVYWLAPAMAHYNYQQYVIPRIKPWVITQIKRRNDHSRRGKAKRSLGKISHS